MRILLELKPTFNAGYKAIDKMRQQDMITELLQGTVYDYGHDELAYPYFCYSNMFKINPFKQGESKHMLISSPDYHFIQTIYHELQHEDSFNFGEYEFIKGQIKKINDPKYLDKIKTTSPVAFAVNKTHPKYFYSFKKWGENYNEWMEKLKQDCLKKYNEFYNDEFTFTGSLFNTYEFIKEVPLLYNNTDRRSLIIGTQWNNLKLNINNENLKFFKFLYDVGLGELNNQGMGMVNTIKKN